MGCNRFDMLVTGLAMVLAAGAPASSTAGASAQPDLQATPLAPSETLQAPPKSASPAQPMPANPYMRRVTTQAMEDLASRLALPVERIEFLEMKSVLWPDRGLGCPRPGMVYLQVQQDGYLIRLRAGKREFDYHGGGQRPPFLCEKAG